VQALLFSHYPEESAVLALILQQAGFSVRTIRSLTQVTQEWPEKPAELILITLPDSGIEALEHIHSMRSQAAVPTIVIAGELTEDTHVRLLEAGADLVVARPFGPRLLLAQIRAVLKRSAGIPFFSLPTLSQRDVILDPAARTVSVNDRSPKRLTQLEFRLLYVLLTNPGQIIPTENLVELVWGYSGEGNRDLVRGLVQRLRSKVEPEPHTPQYILTEPGVGYYFNRYDEA